LFSLESQESKKDNKCSEVGEIHDLNRILEGDCLIEIFDFEHPIGRETFFHSAAHVLGCSLESEFGCHLCHGPPLEKGFFYDCYVGSTVFN
jgi:threonyl-tRNA synthetase